MGKKIRFILAVAFVLSLAGCGNQGNTEKAAEADPVVQGNDNETEKPDFTEPASYYETSLSVMSEEEEETDPSLTADQIEDAKQAALAYYEGTVFNVNSIEHLEGELPYGDMEGDCNFTVNVSRNGIVQEPDRTISLRLDRDGWKVMNEGY